MEGVVKGYRPDLGKVVEMKFRVSKETLDLLNNMENLVLPFYKEDGEVGTVVPVHIYERKREENIVKERFIGFYVVFKDKEPRKILDVGLYERRYSVSDENVYLGLPARALKNYREFSRGEYMDLISSVDTEIIPVLEESGYGDIVTSVVKYIVETDPLLLLEIPVEIVKKRLEEPDNELETIVKQMVPEMFEIFIEELRDRGVDVDKLVKAYREEKSEAKAVEESEEGEKVGEVPSSILFKL